MVESRSTLDFAYGLLPAARTASVNGTAIDLANYGSNTVIFAFGVVTDGTHVPKLQYLGDDGSTWYDVAVADQSGSLSQVTSSSGGSAVQEVSYLGGSRYIRPVVSVTGATTGALSSAVAVLGKKRKQP